MALAAQENVRRVYGLNSFQRDVRKTFHQDFEVRADASKRGAYLSRARSLAVNGVVD